MQATMENLQRSEAGKRKIKIAYSPGDTSLDLWKRTGLHDSKKNVKRLSICEAQQ